MELSNPNVKLADSEEETISEMQSLIRDYLDFRKLILTIDPPGEEELGPDDLNTSVQSGGPIVDDRLNTVSGSIYNSPYLYSFKSLYLYLINKLLLLLLI